MIPNQNNDLKKKARENKLNLSMQIKSPKLILDFQYSKYLDSYYLPIKKIKLFKKHIYITFKVNGENILDPRYSIIDDKGEKFYNILTSKMFYRKNNKEKLFTKIDKKKDNEKKQWEDLFIIKTKRKRSISFDASSISSKTDISKELDRNMGEIYNNQVFQSNNFQKEKKPLQSILKRKSSKNDNLKFKKKVCFENKIEFCE